MNHALVLATALAQEGPMGVADAAARLGVARSTAHRLLAMLVYRGFAEQDDDRRYVPGPMLRGALGEPVSQLRRVALPLLQVLMTRSGETVHLLVVQGRRARFVLSVECDRVLRVGDRVGRELPAHLTSAGRAVLATWPEARVVDAYGGGDPPDPGGPDIDGLMRDLHRIRKQGFAVNDGLTEEGLTAIGRAVRVFEEPPVVGIAIAMPTARYRAARLTGYVDALTETAQLIESALAAPG
ncbi:IclR family transcriptional regulator [Pseudonocardia ailaonensis]|uniref:IclR family transcriptional regulator n=1 Tax=Pseudonocardia ailaonensis TaxID=367279 RepID=UPI0031E13DC2